MEAKLQEAELQLQFTRIVTPVNGVVTSRNVDVGQTVAASFQAPVMFKIAEDLRKMQVNTNVDEADVGRVRVGQRAVFSVPAFPEEIFQASVRQIRNEPKVEQNVVTYNVVLDVDNSDLKLRPGMTANASIILERVQDALLVPDQVFRFNPPEKILRGKKLSNLPALKKGEKRIWTLGPDNLMRPVDVRTGISGSERVQVFSDDLKPGHRVVVSAETDKKSSLQRPGLRLGF
jgi:HlyD family secretion protein